MGGTRVLPMHIPVLSRDPSHTCGGCDHMMSPTAPGIAKRRANIMVVGGRKSRPREVITIRDWRLTQTQNQPKTPSSFLLSPAE